MLQVVLQRWQDLGEVEKAVFTKTAAENQQQYQKSYNEWKALHGSPDDMEHLIDHKRKGRKSKQPESPMAPAKKSRKSSRHVDPVETPEEADKELSGRASQ